jgi:predicted short-subunit dehydrogenase-like oxidoreductase (DUF2520 family)
MNYEEFHIVIIGSGQVARFYANIFSAAGVRISAIISRNSDSGNQLAADLNTRYFSKWEPNTPCDLILIAVNDNSVEEVCAELPALDCIYCHCAGSLSLEVLATKPKRAVMYPLQSIKSLPKASEVPVLLEASDETSYEILTRLLKISGLDYHPVNSEQRLHYHLAAVFANNFTNAILAASEQVSNIYGLRKELLEPLIRRTCQLGISGSALENQTGPAMRADTSTIDKHLEMLKGNKNLQDLYAGMTEFILKSLAHHKH